MIPVSLFLALAAGVGLAWAAWQVPPKRAAAAVHAGLWALLGVLVSGRAAYVAVNWAYYQHHLAEAPQVWLGGFSGGGALLGAALFLWARRLPVDDLLPLASALAAVGWLISDAYGRAMPWGWVSADELGNLTPRWPVQFLGMALTLGVFVPLDLSRQRLATPRLAAALWLLGQAVILFVLSFLRADPAPSWRGLRLEAWAAAGAALCALFTILLSRCHSLFTTKHPIPTL